MEDSTLSDQPGIELDAEMVQRILDNGDQYRQQTIAVAQFIYEYQAAFRGNLIERGLLQVVDSQSEGFDLAAVDGGSVISAHGGGALVAATAYKVSINDERQRGAVDCILVPNRVDLEALATLLRVHLELQLLSSDKLDTDRLVILDHSFWGIMQAVSRGLATYKSHRQRIMEDGRNPDSDALYRAWKKLFQDCLGVNGSFLPMIRNKQVISISKQGISQSLVILLLELVFDSDDIIVGSTLNDRALLRHILRPGEYITPQSLYRTQEAESSIKSWKRSRFATPFEDDDGPDPFETRDQVLDEYGVPRDDGEEIIGNRLFVTYYRPHKWGRVYRVEFHERLLANRNAPVDLSGRGERFQRVLAAIRQSVNREMMEPFCQVLADIRARTAVATAATILPERTLYQLQDDYRNDSELLDIVNTLLSEERT